MNNYLTEKEFLEKNWNKKIEAEHEQAIFEGIARNDTYSAWYKTLTPLSMYLHHTSAMVCPVTGSIIDKPINDDWKEEVVYLETTRDFYGNYFCEGKKYCMASFWADEDSNLDLWKIHLGGTDDCSYSFDILGEKEARIVWGNLFKQVVTDENTKEFYFSN